MEKHRSQNARALFFGGLGACTTCFAEPPAQPMLYSALHGFVCWSHRHTVRSSWVLEAFGHCTSLGECLQGTQDGHRQKFTLPLGRGIWIPTAALSSRGPTCIILVLKGRGRGGDNVGSSLRNAMVQTLGSNLNFPPCK